jgi:L-2-hydroxyglutarate oxidase
MVTVPPNDDPAGHRSSDVVVIGAGLVGLATAMALLRERPSLRLTVLEKEKTIAAHQSGHNSGVIHAGLYYQPGSLKARFCREGRDALRAFADEHGIPYRVTGKLVVAAHERELDRLSALADRGRANGLAVRELSPAEFREMEPNVRGVRALHVPETGVIDFRRVAIAYAEVVKRAGGAIRHGVGVRAISETPQGYRVETADGDSYPTRHVIACAGLQADRIAAMTGLSSGEHRIVPFRGDYYTFRPHAEDLVHGLVYPVPDPAFPFLGVHFTRGVDGTLHAGPNAVPAMAREGYGRLSVNPRDLWDTLRFPGFLRLARSYARTGALEIWRDLVKPAFVADMRRYLPMVTARDVVLGPSGVRAQCLNRSGALVDDFLIQQSAGVVHVLNAPSPAATASIAIGRHLATSVIDRFEL